MIKVIIFDADGVLVLNKRKFSLLLAEKHGISLQKTAIFFNGPFQNCLTGKKDLKKALLPYLASWGWHKGVDAFLDFWFKAEHKIDKKLVDYIQALRKKGILCFLATNNEKHRFAYMLDKMGLSKALDKTYASAHLGHKKPKREFFLKIFKELKNIKKDEILFVDDSVENIAGARKFGIHTEFYVSLNNLKDKLSLLNSK